MNILSPSVSEVIDRSSLERKLRGGKKLRVKLGVDPSAPDLHLGHYIVLEQLRRFSDAGHKIIFLIGDFTGQIGDPTGRKSERPVLGPEKIKENVKTYLDQVSLVLDTGKVEIRYNSEWYGKMLFGDWLKIMQNFTVNQIFERDDFSKRIKAGLPLAMHETIYPMMQAYDSVVLKADVELGGTDQKFNILAGRALQRKMNLIPQDIIIMDLLVGTDGVKKMSKSLGNYIGLTESPEEMFGKVMSIADGTVESYAKLVLGETVTDLKNEEGSDHPKKIKERLAENIVRLFHPGSEKSARAYFDRTVSKKEVPEDIREVSVGAHRESLRNLLIEDGLVASTSDLIKLIKQNAVTMDGELVKEADVRSNIPKGDHIVKIGKRKYIKIVNK